MGDVMPAALCGVVELTLLCTLRVSNGQWGLKNCNIFFYNKAESSLCTLGVEDGAMVV
tara:strand:- start:178 stop:351 length:174 start_codon:yes stop_codon:yes gene_type:complete